MEMQRDRFFSAGCGGDLSVNVGRKIAAGFGEFARLPRRGQKQEFKLFIADVFAFCKARDIQMRFQQFLERARRLGRVNMDIVRRPCVRSSESKRRRQTGINEEFAANAQTLLRRSCRMICQAKLRKRATGCINQILPNLSINSSGKSPGWKRRSAMAARCCGISRRSIWQNVRANAKAARRRCRMCITSISRSYFINGCEAVMQGRVVLGILTYFIYAPVPALRPPLPDSLSPIYEMTSK